MHTLCWAVALSSLSLEIMLKCKYGSSSKYEISWLLYISISAPLVVQSPPCTYEIHPTTRDTSSAANNTFVPLDISISLSNKNSLLFPSWASNLCLVIIIIIYFICHKYNRTDIVLSDYLLTVRSTDQHFTINYSTTQ